MAAILFRCPTTNSLVQHWLDEGEDSEHEYEEVKCLACDSLHFVNRQGKVLGSQEEPS